MQKRLLFLVLIALMALVLVAAKVLGVDRVNENAGLVSLGLTAVLVAATVLYMVLTASLVEETRLLRKAQTSPEVVVKLWPDPRYINWINLVIENIGASTAYNVRFTLPANAVLKDRNLAEIEMLKRGIRHLASGERIESFLLVSHGPLPPAVTIAANFEDALGIVHERSYDLDVSLFRGLGQSEPPIYKIARSIEQMQRDLHYLSTGFNKPTVIVKTAEEERQEREAWMERAPPMLDEMRQVEKQREEARPPEKTE